MAFEQLKFVRLKGSSLRSSSIDCKRNLEIYVVCAYSRGEFSSCNIKLFNLQITARLFAPASSGVNWPTNIYNCERIRSDNRVYGELIWSEGSYCRIASHPPSFDAFNVVECPQTLLYTLASHANSRRPSSKLMTFARTAPQSCAQMKLEIQISPDHCCAEKWLWNQKKEV